MIRYVVRCDQAHKFEAWFRSEADCDRALASNEPQCPVCEKLAAAADYEPAVAPLKPATRPAYQ